MPSLEARLAKVPQDMAVSAQTLLLGAPLGKAQANRGPPGTAVLDLMPLPAVQLAQHKAPRRALAQRTL
jgi:hypothetical protein